MNSIINKAKVSGLLDVVTEWIKTEKYISTSKIQRELSVGYETASSIVEYLIEHDLIDKNQIEGKGYKVKVFNIGIKIYLLDHNPEMVKEWSKAFENDKEITVVEDEFKHFMDTQDIECVVGPANAWGIMSGGYDLAITNYYGDALQKTVQRYIRHHLYGEQPIGTSIIVDIPNTKQKLIQTPTMQISKPIKDKFIIYQCMRTTLMTALENKIKTIVIPAFGGDCGKVHPKVVATKMKEAYDQIVSRR